MISPHLAFKLGTLTGRLQQAKAEAMDLHAEILEIDVPGRGDVEEDADEIMTDVVAGCDKSIKAILGLMAKHAGPR